MCEKTPREVNLEPETGDIIWGEEKAFRMSSAAVSFTLTLMQFDGSKKVIPGAISSDWFITTYDPSTKILVFKPRSIQEAMR